jgi:hypothetical protein
VVQAKLGKDTSLCLKNNQSRKMAWGCLKWVEYLPSKCEALSLNPSSEKKQKDLKSRNRIYQLGD